MYHTHRAVSAVFLAAALATGTAACGTSASSAGAKAAKATPKPTASRDPLAGLTAGQVATKALADIEAAGSVNITGTVPGSKNALTFDLTLVPGKDCQANFSEPKGSFKLIYIGKNVWVKGNRALYKNMKGIDSAALSILSGKWLKIKAKSSGFGSLASMCKLSKLLGGFGSSAPTGLVKGSTAAIGGQRAVKIMDIGDSAYMYVSDTARPELIRIADPGSGGGTLDFTVHDTTATITAPPASNVLDGSKYGF